MEPKIIRNWEDLIGLETSEYILEINTDMGYGWIRNKKDFNSVCYLSTHTFYEKKCEFSTKLLNAYGFNVKLIPWM